MYELVIYLFLSIQGEAVVVSKPVLRASTIDAPACEKKGAYELTRLMKAAEKSIRTLRARPQSFPRGRYDIEVVCKPMQHVRNTPTI